MLKLTSAHIDQIRKYFLATGEEEKTILQKNITPDFPGGFLNDLKQLFIYKPNDENRLLSIGKSIGAEQHIETLKEIQHDYYSHLASIFNRGESNADIELLLKVNNPLFAKEISYQLNIQKSFRLDARKDLKKKFQDIDTNDDMQTDEMFKAFRLIERQKLKKAFEGLEVPRTSMTGSGQDVFDSSLSMPEDNNEIAGDSIKRKFNWMRFAIAASIIGFLFLAGYLFILRDGKQENNRMAKNRENEIILFGKENNLSGNNKSYEVKEQGPLGLTNAEKTDSLIVVVRDVKSIAELIEFKKSFLLNKPDSVNSMGPIAKNNHHVLDSLNSLQEYLLSIVNTYIYNPEKKTIILNVSNADSVNGVYRYSAGEKPQTIYIRINSLFYKIKQVNDPLALEQVTKKEVIKELEKIQPHN